MDSDLDPYRVQLNYCDCHPETCACNDWAVYREDKKISSHYFKEDALEAAKALNLRLENKEYVEAPIGHSRGNMTTQTEAIRKALDLLRKKEWEACDYASNANEAADVLEQALAQPEQEPVALKPF